MIYEIPFGKETITIDISPKNFLYYALPNVQETETKDSADIIEDAFNHPIGSKRLEDMVRSNMKVLILLDDITRPTPKKLLLSYVLERLATCGVPDENISLVFALGTHRPMTHEEVLELLGTDIVRRFPIINNSYKDKQRFVNIGLSPNGIPIEVYHEVIEADFKIGIGNIVPHVSAGWGGGAKIIQPGVCGEITTQRTHLIACLEQNVMETCGNAENKCRHEMEIIAQQVGLQFIVNTVMDEHTNIHGVFCGHFIKAHRAGVEFAKKILCPKIPAKADILIASANPCHIDFWQGGKPYVYAQYGLREGGTLIFVIEGNEGLCGNSPEHDYTVRHYCLSSEETIRTGIKNGSISDLIGVDVPIFQDQIRKRGINILLVSKGFSEADAACLGFEKTTGLEDALEKAFSKQGKDAKVGIIPYAGETLVRCEN